MSEHWPNRMISDIHRQAEDRYQEYLRTGRYISWQDMRAYLLARVRGESPQKPVVRVLSSEDLQKLNQEHHGP